MAFVGMAICIFFLPGLVIGLIVARRPRSMDFDMIAAIDTISTPIHIIGYGILLLLVIMTSIKRIRDAGEGI